MSTTDAVVDPAPSASDAPDPSSEHAAPRGLGRPFGAQLASTGLANLGDGVLQTLAPLVALGLTTSPQLISLLSAAAWLPWLLLGIAAGVVIDRVDRRSAQVVALVARAALLAVAAALALTGNLTMPALLAVALLYGVTEVFADLGASAIVPDLVPTDRLAAANGRVIGVQQVANTFLGAPLAGAFIVVGVGIGFGASAALAALAALVLAFGLRGSYRHRAVAVLPDGDVVAPEATDAVVGSNPGRSGKAARTGARAAISSALGDVREGITFLVHHPVMRPLIINSSLLNMASTAYFAVFVLWAVGPTSHIGLTKAQYPLVMLGFAAGAVAGSLLAEKARSRFGELQTIIATLIVNSLLLLVPLWISNGWALVAVLAVVGMLNTIGNVVGQALRQRIVPRELLGRVSGAGRTLAYGLMPVGAVLGGLVAERWGLPVTFVGAVVISVLSCLYLALRVRPSTLAQYEPAAS